MDIYLAALVLGAAGLAIMAIGGLGHHAGHHAGHHGGHDAGLHGGHPLGPHLGHDAGHAAHGITHGAHATPASHAAHGHAPSHAGDAHAAPSPLWLLASPRVLFSVLLGFGAAGMLGRPWLGGVALLALAVAGGVALEWLVVRPLWTFLFGFASRPALTLESALLEEARAASRFDANGEGLVAVEVDGQVVQLLGRLRDEDRALGVRVRAGAALRVEEVDVARHRCVVSYLRP